MSRGVSLCSLVLVVPMLLAAVSSSESPPSQESVADGRCDGCGGCEGVRKVCVPKPVEREIKKVCWDAKCEEFCVPGPSEYCGRKQGRDECGCWWYDIWKPSCAEVRTRQVPVKRVTTRKVPGVEWKLEERCAACRHRGGDEPECAAR